MSRFAAFCFDFDGVLVDSEPLHFEAERRALAAHGIVLTPEAKTPFVGDTVEGTAVRMARHFGVADAGAFFRERQRHFRELVAARLGLLPGVRDALARLRARGLPCAVVSSGERDYVVPALERLGVRPFFATVVTMEDVGVHKPAPDPYLEAVRRLGVSPWAAVAVEDSPTGVASARAAGLFCIAVPSPATAGADLSAAQVRLGSLAELDDALLARLLEPAGRAGG